MSAVRILGAIAAIVFFAFVARRYGRRHISKRNLIISFAITVAVLALAASPSLFDPVLGLFVDVRPQSNRRFTFVLLLAVIVLFYLVIRAQSGSDWNERSLRLLVEALGRERFDWAGAGSLPEGRRLITVSPAYNEAENVAAVIKAMPDRVDGLHVISLVVSDGSEDDTADVARSAGALVAELPIRRGGGLALRVGYEIALKLDAEIVVTLDADGQHLPEELSVVIAPILAGEADYVNGSRLLGTFERESMLRHIGVHFFSRLVTVLTGRRITDPSSGFRAARADLLRRLVLNQDQFWTSEVLIEALRQRATIAEVPITIVARKGGKSKKPKSLRYGWNFSKAIFQTWLR